MLHTSSDSAQSLAEDKRSRARRCAKYLFCLLLLGSSSLMLLLALESNGAGSAQEMMGASRASASTNESLAGTLERQVRVLCWVMTMPKNHKTKALHIRRTWGSRCTRLLFVTTQPDDELDTINVPIEEDYWSLWDKTRSAFAYVYQHHKDEADWFLKADDDTYVFMENLRYMLYPYSPDMPIYFGYKFHLYQQRNASYMSGGSGYVLSREAVRRFVELGLPDNQKCKPANTKTAEDVEVGVCLQAVGVVAGDSRDLEHKLRFCPFQAHSMLHTTYLNYVDWFLKYSYYRVRACRDCVSKHAVAFHYIPPEQLYLLEYFGYHFELHDGKQEEESAADLPPKLHWDELIIPEADNSLADIS